MKPKPKTCYSRRCVIYDIETGQRSEAPSLTKAVIEGRKTMTRRIVPDSILRMAQFEARELVADLKKGVDKYGIPLNLKGGNK